MKSICFYRPDYALLNAATCFRGVLCSCLLVKMDGKDHFATFILFSIGYRLEFIHRGSKVIRCFNGFVASDVTSD